ncbi:SRPBCC family protein [Gordonia sp. NPDC003376]
MPGVSHSSTVAVPRERVFAYVNDYQNVPRYMFGITTFSVLSEITSGKGSTFEAALDLGPTTLRSTVETTDWVENELIELTSIAGFGADTRWRFTDTADGGTEVGVEFRYALPGGLTGRALGALLGPFAGQAIRQTEINLREQIR